MISELNTESIDDYNPFWAKTEFIVLTGDSSANFNFWKEFSKEAYDLGHRQRYLKREDLLDYKQLNPGEAVTVGWLNKKPIVLSAHWDQFNGRTIGFMYPCSNIVDKELVDTWLKKNCNPYYKGTRAICDALNFHHAYHYCLGK